MRCLYSNFLQSLANVPILVLDGLAQVLSPGFKLCLEVMPRRSDPLVLFPLPSAAHLLGRNSMLVLANLEMFGAIGPRKVW